MNLAEMINVKCTHLFLTWYVKSTVTTLLLDVEITANRIFVEENNDVLALDVCSAVWQLTAS